MKWVLVYILVTDVGNAYAVNAYTPKYSFDKMEDCFVAREKLALRVGGTQEGYFPSGSQAICVGLER